MVPCKTCKLAYIKALEKWEVWTVIVWMNYLDSDKYLKKWHIYVIIISWNSHIFWNYSQKLNNWPVETSIVQTLLKESVVFLSEVHFIIKLFWGRGAGRIGIICSKRIIFQFMHVIYRCINVSRMLTL